MEPYSSRILHQNNNCNNQTQNHSNNNNNTNSNLVNSSNQSSKRNQIVRQSEDNKRSGSYDAGCAANQVTGDHVERDENEANKSHVGPVMGIFFKVWSLVKVTKVRHQNKMRRQNSEDTSQFQYLSGDQLVGHHRPAILQDRHFRRAGSQPAPSSSAICRPLDTTHHHNQPLPPQSMARLQVAPGGSSFSTTTNSLANITTGTSSTSSGVSSTSSAGGQQLNSTNQTPSPPPMSSTSGVRRHLSAYSLRRSTAEVPVPIVKPKTATKSSDSWASKIKRSATTVNQTDFSSYVSRYRFRGARDQTSRLLQKAPEPAPLTSSDHRQGDTTTNGGSASHESEPTLNHSDNDDDDDEDIRIASGDDNEDTSNDIYSTPHDSIQSVPSTAPVISNEKLAQKGVSVTRQAPSQVYPITKSFSTNNFNHLLQQQQQPPPQQQKFLPIQETDNSNLSGCRTASDSTDRRLHSSRFFISSSSSEDSNHQSSTVTANACTNSSGSTTGANNRQNSNPCNSNQLFLDQALRETQLEQYHQQVAVQQGVHCHKALAQRPNSLLVVGSQPGSYAMPVSVLTPAACRGLALPLSANSPLDSMPQLVASHHRQPLHQPHSSYLRSGYRKSPSLLEMSNVNGQAALPARGLSSRFSSKYPIQSRVLCSSGGGPEGGLNSFRPLAKVAPSHDSQGQDEVAACDDEQRAPPASATTHITSSQQQPPFVGHPMPNSISLYDCKLSSQIQPEYQQRQLHEQYPLQFETAMAATTTTTTSNLWPDVSPQPAERPAESSSSEYRLAQMLLECNSNASSKDENGFTALMHAVLSDNLPALKCLVEHGADLNDTNQTDHTALDLLCSRPPTKRRLEILKLLIDNGADLDRARAGDGSRLLDRLIDEHHHCADKLPFIECLLQSGAKLGSSTWLAASGKQEIQLRLLQKLCQDGYFLYKKSSIEAAVYRFEYALKRLAELEQQLAATNRARSGGLLAAGQLQFIPLATRQLKYQTYLGLSRCERKRKFYKRALEFAHLAILVDSTSYEGFYSKAHILKDLGETDDALLAIDQTQRLVSKSIENIQLQLNDLQQQEEALVFDGCFNMLDPRRSNWIEASRVELSGNLDYMQEAKRFVSRLKAAIMDDKLKSGATTTMDGSESQASQTAKVFSTITKPIAI